jgi:hypothetical protein
MSNQPKALLIAAELLEPIPNFPEPTTLEKAAAAELRRLHASNAELLAALRYYRSFEDHQPTPASVAIANATGGKP